MLTNELRKLTLRGYYMDVKFDFANHPLCYTPDGLALHPRVEDDIVFWFDPRERAFRLHKVHTDQEDKLDFEDHRGRRHILQPLTLEAYAKHVRPKLIGAPELDTEEALRKQFL